MHSQLHLRLPEALHKQLKAKAREQGMTMNTLVLVLIAGGLGFKLDANKEGSPSPSIESDRKELPPAYEADEDVAPGWEPPPVNPVDDTPRRASHVDKRRARAAGTAGPVTPSEVPDEAPPP